MTTTLPQQLMPSLTVEAIYRSYEARAEQRQPRRLGASQIGKRCDRALWYSFRHCTQQQFDGRMLRLFDTGHREELRLIDDLRAIGCEVHACDDASGEQFEFVAVGGHFVCKIDGAARGIPEAPKTWHVCEFKTANDKQFAKISGEGVRKAKPEHYAQCVIGMALSGMKRALYLVRNKNTDHLYAERLRWEECREDAEAFIERAEWIIKSTTPPERFTSDPDHFECRFCEHRVLCFGIREADAPAVPCNVSCRNCVHATPVVDNDVEGGEWRCELHRKALSDAEQANACPSHLFIPPLVQVTVNAEPVDAGEGWIEYRNSDNTTWRNGPGDGDYSSVALASGPGPLIESEGTQQKGGDA